MLLVFSMLFTLTHVSTFKTAAAGSVTVAFRHEDKMVHILVSELTLLVKLCLKLSFKSAPLLSEMNSSLHCSRFRCFVKGALS